MRSVLSSPMRKCVCYRYTRLIRVKLVYYIHPEAVQALRINEVRGRLKAHIAFWERIDAPEFMLDTIRHGYKIPFLHEPTRMIMTNNNSAHVYRDFVEEAIQELLASSRISEVHMQ